MAASRHRIRVRYGETDRMGVAHHSSYVAWIVEARVEALRLLGASYREMEDSGRLMPVVDLHLEYRKPVGFDDELDLATRCEVVSPTRVRFITEIRCRDAHIATGTVTVACIDKTGRPQRVPPEVVDAIARLTAAPESTREP